jgi:hypothetical protein
MLPVVRDILDLHLDNATKDEYDLSLQNQQRSPFLASWYTSQVQRICRDEAMASSTRFEFASVLGDLGLDRCGVNMRLKCKTLMDMCAIDVSEVSPVPDLI